MKIKHLSQRNKVRSSNWATSEEIFNYLWARLFSDIYNRLCKKIFNVQEFKFVSFYHFSLIKHLKNDCLPISIHRAFNHAIRNKIIVKTQNRYSIRVQRIAIFSSSYNNVHT